MIMTHGSNSIIKLNPAPTDGFYVARGNTWIKVYDLTVTPIEGYPIDNEDYDKIGEFNGNLYQHVKIEVTDGPVTIGLFNYNTMEYDSETTVTDSTSFVSLSSSGQYEIHAKGSGTVSVTVSADAFDGGEDDET